MDDSEGVEWTHWCVGGKTNMVLNCQDRHRQIAIYEKTYLIWEGENGICRQFTSREFDKEVCKFASALKQLEYGKGDVVGLYLPRIPETLMAYFAIIKIGALVMPLFSGFGPQAKNLIKNVFPVKGFNLSESRMKTFAEMGGKLTSNPALVFCF